MENVWCKLVELEYARLQLIATSIAQQMVQNQKYFESRTVDTVHVPLSPYRMLFLTYIMYYTVLEFYTVYEIYTVRMIMLYVWFMCCMYCK